MERLESIRKVVDEVLAGQQDPWERRCGFVHLYGVSIIGGQLALRRGLDPEVASAAGMLHDIYAYRTGLTRYHAHNSEEDARVILKNSGDFTEEEQQIIRSAIFNHSDQVLEHHGPYDELLKDADVLQHYLYALPAGVEESTARRLRRIFKELGMSVTLEVLPEVGREGREGRSGREGREGSSNREDREDRDDNRDSSAARGAGADRRAILASIAEDLAGRPLRGDDNKSGPDVYPLIRYFPGATVSQGFDWCASFVYHCCMEAGFVLPIKHPDPVPCRFAAVKAWLTWAQLSETSFFYSGDDRGFEPQRGDIVIFDDLVGNGPHDHIGVVLVYNGERLTTAEGNVENRSGIFTRHRHEKVNGFIRIDNRYQYGQR